MDGEKNGSKPYFFMDDYWFGGFSTTIFVGSTPIFRNHFFLVLPRKMVGEEDRKPPSLMSQTAEDFDQALPVAFTRQTLPNLADLFEKIASEDGASKEKTLLKVDFPLLSKGTRRAWKIFFLFCQGCWSIMAIHMEKNRDMNRL